VSPVGTRNWLYFLPEYSAFFARYFLHDVQSAVVRAALVRSNAGAKRPSRASTAAATDHAFLAGLPGRHLHFSFNAFSFFGAGPFNVKALTGHSGCAMNPPSATALRFDAKPGPDQTRTAVGQKNFLPQLLARFIFALRVGR
jgi:hypothetical protein